MKRTLSLLLAIALTLTMVTPAFAAAPNANAGTGTAASEKAAVEKTWITFNEKGLTLSKGKTVYMPYQLSKTNPAITVKNIGGIVCLQFVDTTGKLRLISLGNEENLVFNGTFPALTIDASIKKANITFGANAAIGKFTVNGTPKVNIHGKMSVSELTVNGAATVNFAKDAKIGKATVTSPNAKINVPSGAPFKVTRTNSVGASALPSRGHGGGGGGGGGGNPSTKPEDPVTPPTPPAVEDPVASVSTQAEVNNLGTKNYKEIIITGSNPLNLSNVSADLVTVQDPDPKNAFMPVGPTPGAIPGSTPTNKPGEPTWSGATPGGAPARTPVGPNGQTRANSRLLTFSNKIDSIVCLALANIESATQLLNFTAKKDGIVMNADVKTLNAEKSLALNGTADTITAANALTLSGYGSANNIVTAHSLTLTELWVNTVTVTAGANGATIDGTSAISNLIAQGVGTTTIATISGSYVIESVTAYSSLTIAKNASVREVIVPATAKKDLKITANEILADLQTAKTIEIAGTGHVSRVTVVGTTAVTLTVTNTAETPTIGTTDGANVTAKDKDGGTIAAKEQFKAPVAADVTVANRTDATVTITSKVQEGGKYQYYDISEATWKDVTNNSITVKAPASDEEEHIALQLKQVAKTEGVNKYQSQTIYVEVIFAGTPSFSPANGAIDVAIDAPISIYFAMPITFDGKVIDLVTLTEVNGGAKVDATASYNRTNESITIVPKNALKNNTEYKAAIVENKIKYSAANIAVPVKTATFTTIKAVDGNDSATPLFTTDLTATKTVVEDAELKLTVVASASDSGNLTYQWYKNDVAIENANATTYTIASAKGTDAGYYNVVVTNKKDALPSAKATSKVCMVTVTPKKTAITAIADITGTVKVGETLTAGAVTPIDATVSYQWQMADKTDGTYGDISGATGKTFVLTEKQKGKFIKVQATGKIAYTGTVLSTAAGVVAAGDATGDVVAPTPTFTPANGVTGIAINPIEVKIKFNEVINLTDKTVAAAVTFKKGNTDVQCTVSLATTKDEIKIVPNANLANNTAYTVSIVADKIADAAGNKVAAASATFTTVAETDAELLATALGGSEVATVSGTTVTLKANATVAAGTTAKIPATVTLDLATHTLTNNGTIEVANSASLIQAMNANTASGTVKMTANIAIAENTAGIETFCGTLDGGNSELSNIKNSTTKGFGAGCLISKISETTTIKNLVLVSDVNLVAPLIFITAASNTMKLTFDKVDVKAGTVNMPSGDNNESTYIVHSFMNVDFINCTNNLNYNSTVNGMNTSAFVGGYIGDSKTKSLTINFSGCNNTGDLTMSNASLFIGNGFHMADTTITVNNCTNTGKIEGTLGANVIGAIGHANIKSEYQNDNYFTELTGKDLIKLIAPADVALGLALSTDDSKKLVINFSEGQKADKYQISQSVYADISDRPGNTNQIKVTKDFVPTAEQKISIVTDIGVYRFVDDQTNAGATASLTAGTAITGLNVDCGCTVVPDSTGKYLIITDDNASIEVIKNKLVLNSKPIVTVNAYKNGKLIQTVAFTYGDDEIGAVLVKKSKAIIPPTETILTLRELKVNDVMVEGFNAETLDYTVNLAAGTVDVPVVAATGFDPKATVEILQASDLSTAAKVTVSGTNGTKVYTVNFVVAAPTAEEIAAKEAADAAAKAAADKAAADKVIADEAAAKLAADEKAAADKAAAEKIIADEAAAKLAAEEAAKTTEKPATDAPADVPADKTAADEAAKG